MNALVLPTMPLIICPLNSVLFPKYRSYLIVQMKPLSYTVPTGEKNHNVLSTFCKTSPPYGNINIPHACSLTHQRHFPTLRYCSPGVTVLCFVCSHCFTSRVNSYWPKRLCPSSWECCSFQALVPRFTASSLWAGAKCSETLLADVLGELGLSVSKSHSR